ENLRFFGRLYGMSGSRLRERIDWALDFAGLEDRRHRRVRTFSGGMKRRLNLVGALVHGPRLVLLDEPTVGVDPQSRHHLHECIEQLRREDVTILYTTHDMGEAQRLCDRIAIVDHGRLLALDTVDALLEAHGGHAVVEARIRGDVDLDLPGTRDGDRLRVETDQPFETVNAIA
ncbi:MAG: ABC transporter ATP-binding protein, partial [Verrucomicrobiae bacterium]|nr:ABC transporter ATP-binding protein [Verrucomicrobiae bacterium]